MKKELQKSFFNRSAVTVAEELLGKFLVCRRRGRERAFMITETEGYEGFEDRASHAHKGETARNRVMFGEAGHWYVYLIYGMYDMLNIVTGKKKYPAAVLIRGMEGITGPGRLTKALGITRKSNTLPAAKKSGLWIEDRGVQISKKQIKKTPRIGVSYAGPVWSKKYYRFVLNK